MSYLDNLKNAIQGNLPSLVTMLKEKRFTSTARVLGDTKALGVTVQIVNNPQAGVAWWDSVQRTIVLNDALPHTKDSKLTLIWERAKLFHELFHVLFTTNEKLRKELMFKSNNQQRYLWVSNALEDGRIEHFGGKLFAGTTWYIRTLLGQLVTANTPDSGLLLYVRTGKWRNAKEAKFWGKYQTLIDECITAPDSDVVWRNAHAIVQDTEKPQPKQPPQPPPPKPPEGDEGEDGDDEGEGTPTPTDDDDGEQDEEESEDDEGGEDAESPKDGDDVEGEEEGGSGRESSNEPETGSEEQETPSQPTAPTQPPTPQDAEMDEDIEDELREMVEDAMDQIAEEVDAELVEINREAADYVAEQEYKGGEERIADELTEVFASILVESNRQKFSSCKYGGTLDPKRLIETQTGGEFMREEVRKASQPHIVLLLDQSYSMSWQLRELSQAARILNGSIQACGAKSICYSFGAIADNTVVEYKTIPTQDFYSGHGTPTYAGLIAAREWLVREQAKRGMVIVVTDGDPSGVGATELRFQELSNEGFYVLNVLLGGADDPAFINTMKTMCHDYVIVKDASGLVRGLEEPISNFMSGAF